MKFFFSLFTMTRSTRRLKGSRQPKPALASSLQPTAGGSKEPSLLPSDQPAPRRSKYKSRALDLSSGEEFDLNLNDLNLNASDSAEESVVLPRSSSPASIQPTAGSSRASTRPVSPILLVPPPPKSKSRKAEDIEYFFEVQTFGTGKEAYTKKVCKSCRCVTVFVRVQGSTNKELSIRDISSELGMKHRYSLTTSNSTLRTHLGAAHRELYERACKLYGWENKLPGATKSDISISSEMQAQVQTPFTMEVFVNHLVNFITADDQVSMLAYGCFYQANLPSSRSMLSNALSFELSFSSCAQGCTFSDKPKRQKPYSMHTERILLI
jgi:hypothetical protein